MDVTLKQYLTTFAYNDDFADICYRNRPQEVNEIRISRFLTKKLISVTRGV